MRTRKPPLLLEPYVGTVEDRIIAYQRILDENDLEDDVIENFRVNFIALINEFRYSEDPSLIAVFSGYVKAVMTTLCIKINTGTFKRINTVYEFLEASGYTVETRHLIEEIEEECEWHNLLLSTIFNAHTFNELQLVFNRFTDMMCGLSYFISDVYPDKIAQLLHKVYCYRSVSDHLENVAILKGEASILEKELAARIRILMFEVLSEENLQRLSDAVASDEGVVLSRCFKNMKLTKHIRERLPVPTNKKS